MNEHEFRWLAGKFRLVAAEIDELAEPIRTDAQEQVVPPDSQRDCDRPPRETKDSLQTCAPPTRTSALISWAHRDPEWDDATADRWRDSVLGFTAMLRSRGGIDADIDLYHSDDLVIDWTRFGPRRIEETDFTLVVISNAWSDRWAGRNSPSVGAGAVGEADQLKGMFQKDQKAFQERTKLVLLPGVPESAVPSDLSRLSRYSVDPDDFSSFEPLLRALTGQPSILIPELAEVPVLPPAISAKTSVTSSNRPRRNSESENLRTELRVLRRRRQLLSITDAELHDESIARLDDEIAVLESLADSMYADDADT